MKAPIIYGPRLVWGVPEVRKPFTPPVGSERCKLRFRNDNFAVAIIKVGNEVFRRPLLDKDDRWEAADARLEQGRNVTLKRA